jgi:hypothetical protein
VKGKLKLILLISVFILTASALFAQDTAESDELPGLDLDTNLESSPSPESQPAESTPQPAEPQSTDPVQTATPAESETTDTDPLSDQSLQTEAESDLDTSSTPQQDDNQNQGESLRFNKGDESVFYYTYIGPFFQSGFNSISYTGWNGGSHREIESGGFYTEPGALCFISIDQIIAQIGLGFRLNFNDETATEVYHTKLHAIGKYMTPVANNIALGGGGGLYFESIPASKQYDGTGLLLAASATYRLNSNWILLLDFDFGFGNFGLGEESTKISYGITFGAGTKMGNL